MAIKVFGKEAKAIEEGDEFRAVKYSIEGHDVVELIPRGFFCNVCATLMKVIDIGHDDTDLECQVCAERNQ